MKDIISEVYKKVLSFFNSEPKEENSKDTACNRLKLVLMQDRAKMEPALMEKMREEMIEVISKYVEIDKEALDLNLEAEGESFALMLNIPVLRAKTREEIEAAEGISLDEDDEDDDLVEEDNTENEEEEETEEENEDETVKEGETDKKSLIVEVEKFDVEITEDETSDNEAQAEIEEEITKEADVSLTQDDLSDNQKSKPSSHKKRSKHHKNS